jgi:MFS family permease
VTDRAWLVAICASELGTLLVFSNFPALQPLLQREWQLSSAQAGMITGVYQIGYIAAVAILATLTDYMAPRRIYLGSALWTVLTSLAFAAWADGFASALVLRALVGLGLAGTYMPGMRLVAERFARGGRGFAMGCYIGTFTIGTSLSLLLTSQANVLWGWRVAFAVTALGPLAAAIIGWFVLPRGMAAVVSRQVSADGGRAGASGEPQPAVGAAAGGEATIRGSRRAEPRSRPPLMVILKNRAAIRLIIAYSAHTYELMAMRGWILPFFTAALVARGADLTDATRTAGLAASAVLAIGALPHPFSGMLSDRFGRARLTSSFMLVSAACSFAVGWALHWPWPALVALGLLYGILVTSESAIVSTGIAEAAEPRYLGRTMAVQSTLGFASGAIAPAVFGLVLDVVPRLGGSTDAAWIAAFALSALVALMGPLAVGFKEFSRRPVGV